MPVDHARSDRRLSTLEIVTTLLLGPQDWQRTKIGSCSVGGLGERLRPVLEERLAAELHRTLERWAQTDIRKLRDVRAKAVEAAEREEEERQKGFRLATQPNRERPKRERPKREDRPRPGAFFTPPPKT